MSDTLIMRDIRDIPLTLRDTLAGIGDEGDRLASGLLARGARRFVAIGNGTSYYASLASAYLHNRLIGPDQTLVLAAPTGDFSQYPLPLSQHDAVVGVSVSGEVVDLLDLFEQIHGQHRLVGITNEPSSSLSRLADDLLVTYAGPSVVPTSTKTFVASVAALYLLWLGVLKQQGVDGVEGLRKQLDALPELAEQGLAAAERQVTAAAERLAPCQRVFVMGAGPAWAVAQEAALVLKEVSNVPAEPLQQREMAQGTTSVVDDTVGVIAVNPPGPGQSIGRELLAQCTELGAVTVELGTAPADLTVDVSCHDLLTPILYCGPLFVLANELAIQRGVDADHPHWEEGHLRMTRRQTTS
jgi:glucosamine--fructose-6-phosphate aminotransferase (isomerizing)